MFDLTKCSDEELKDLVTMEIVAELKNRGYTLGWNKETDYVGAIYIMVNPAFPNLVKIGYADDVRKRLKSLSKSSGLPDPYHCFAIYKVKKRLEDLRLHTLIDTLDSSLRHAKNREFYEMDCNKAYDILDAIAQINGSDEQLVLNPFSDEYIAELSKCKKITNDIDKPKKAPRMTFEMLNIPIGSVLTYIKNSDIQCVTVDMDNKVKYEGKTYTISGLAQKLLKVSSARGGAYFLYNGEILTDIRKRLNK